MIPNRQLGYNYIASTSNVFTEGKSYKKIDNYGVDGASNVLSWKSGETGGEYKYKIYFYEGSQIEYRASKSFRYGENKNKIWMLDGKQYTKGEYCELIDNQLQNVLSYGHGISLKFVGYENYTGNDLHLQEKDVYKKLESGKAQTVGIDFDDVAKIKSNYSDHHFSIFITYRLDTASAYVAPPDILYAIGTIHYGSITDELTYPPVYEHEFLHGLRFTHVNNDSKEHQYTNVLMWNAPFHTGKILDDSNTVKPLGLLGLTDDAIHGLDVIYNLSRTNHIKITGTVNQKDHETAEKFNNFSNLGFATAYLVVYGSNELYYQAPIDSTGYFEFRCVLPGKYLKTVYNLQFYVFVVNSAFLSDSASTKATKYGGLGRLIYWGKSSLFNFNNVSLPYIKSLSEIRMNNSVYETEGDLRGGVWYSNIYDRLKEASGTTVTYKPYVPKAKSYEAKKENEFICGVK